MVFSRNLFVTLFLALALMVLGAHALYSSVRIENSAGIGIIGGSDGPTAVFVAIPAEDAAP